MESLNKEETYEIIFSIKWRREERKMLNIIWPIFIIISFVYAVFSGNIDSINNGIFDSCKSAVELSISFLGTMCLWSGIMEIAQRTSLISKLTHALSPIIRFLFPELKREEKAKEEISMNMIANILGLGNAATPLGLKAMKTLQEKNPQKDTVSNSMAMFIILNTASLQLIPTTTIAIRNSLGSSEPTKIIIPVWIATVCAAVAGVIACKILTKKIK